MTLRLTIVLLASTLMYLYIHYKTNMNLKLLFIDNVIVGLVALGIGLIISQKYLVSTTVSVVLLPFIAYAGIQLRFWRTPRRKINAMENQIVSPADGNIIYINRIDENTDFVSIKNGRLSELSELTCTDMISRPCIQIGINMTPFDVHKNCSPLDGTIILSKHTHGQFHSLKDFLSLTENERHTYVIQNESCRIGVVQIASKRVRRIDSYVKQGQFVRKGEWIGMIRFGSQVDVFLPIEARIHVKLKQQIYAKSTIIAEV